MGGGYFRRTVNKKVIVPLIGIITLIILVIGISYAAFTYSGIGEKENVITTGTITMAYNEGSNGITLSNAIPMEDAVGKQLKDDNQMFDFTVQINIIGKTTISYEVTAEKDEEVSTLENDKVRIYLEKSEVQDQYNPIIEPSSYIPLVKADSFGAKEGEMVLDIGSTNKTATLYYRLKMWVSKDYELAEESKKFTIKVNVYGSDGVLVKSRYIKDFGEDNSNANSPQLVGDMIPVVWDEENKTWVKSPTTQRNYYNYDNQNWANAVTIKEEAKRAEYKNAPIGTEIKMEDINTMWVWIPRYSYALKGQYGYKIDETASEPSKDTPGAFDIKFVDTTTTDKGDGKYEESETAEGNYYTPSSFCWGNTCDDEEQRSNSGNKELSGIWISKFELTGTIDDIQSKPNAKSLVNQSISSVFNSIKERMNGDNGKQSYGFDGEQYDTHMIKNTEWGAFVYLSQSKYGKYGNSNYTGVNKEIYINDCNGYQTGCSKGAPGTGATSEENSSKECLHKYYEEESGTGASTTGTIYGIYDTSGGPWENVMGYLSEGTLISSEFEKMPDQKYYNSYTDSKTSIKGDAINSDGTASFYGDNQGFLTSSYPWFVRGGHYIDGVLAGIFSFYNGDGGAHYYATSRLALSAW